MAYFGIKNRVRSGRREFKPTEIHLYLCSGELSVEAGIDVNRARMPPLSNSGKRNDEIAETLCVNRNTLLGVKKRYLKGGLATAIHDGERSGQPKKYREEEAAENVELACSSPPSGKKKWSVRLITENMKKKKGFEGINRESVRLILKKRHKTMEEKNVRCH